MNEFQTTNYTKKWHKSRIQTKRVCSNPSQELYKAWHGVSVQQQCTLQRCERALFLKPALSSTAGRSSAGGKLEKLGHNCGEVWHQNIFIGGLCAATELQSHVGCDMGSILNNHELGVLSCVTCELGGLCLRQGPSTSQHCLCSQHSLGNCTPHLFTSQQSC